MRITNRLAALWRAIRARLRRPDPLGVKVHVPPSTVLLYPTGDSWTIWNEGTSYGWLHVYDRSGVRLASLRPESGWLMAEVGQEGSGD